MPHIPQLCEFRAALFDVDGTLVDTLELVIRGIGDAAEKFLNHRPSDEEIRGLIGVPLRRQMVHYGALETETERIDTMVSYAINRFEDLVHLESEFEPAVATLRLCKKHGLKTALVTSKGRAEVDHFLSRFSARDAVDAIVCSDDVQHPKPDPECAMLACKLLSVAPESAIFFGDSIYDMRCARAAGITPVAVTFGAASYDVLAAEQPDLILSQPEDLFAWAESAFLQTPCRERS